MWTPGFSGAWQSTAPVWMILENTHLPRTRLLPILLVPLFAGCDVEFSKRLEFGEPVPDARLEVRLDREYSKAELTDRFTRVSVAGGLIPESTSYTESPIDPRKPLFFGAYDHAGAKKGHFRVAFSTGSDALRPSSFTFIYYDDNTHGLDAEDWLAFFAWVSRIEQEFPGAETTVTKHPVQTTPRSEVSRIVAETGIPLPAGYDDSRDRIR